jgi:hypothetical protein
MVSPGQNAKAVLEFERRTIMIAAPTRLRRLTRLVNPSEATALVAIRKQHLAAIGIGQGLPTTLRSVVRSRPPATSALSTLLEGERTSDR